MSHQLALCARVVRTGDITSVLNFGITIDDFTEMQAKSFWSMILLYYTQPESRGSVIDETALREYFPTLNLQNDMPNVTIETICFEVRRSRIVTEANASFVQCMTDLSIPMTNPSQSLQVLHKKMSDLIGLGATANTDVTLKAGFGNMLRKMASSREGVNTSIGYWPWQPLQDQTFGVQPDDYVILYGRPKSMKTWVLCSLLSNFYSQGKKILVYTKEMTPDNVYMRTLACICELDYGKLREAVSAGKPLPLEDELRLYKTWNDIKDDPFYSNQLVVLSGRDVPSGGDTVAWLTSKIDQYHPDMMMVDGMYLLSDQNKAKVDHHRVMNISRDLRQMVLGTGVPVIATMQANRKAAAHNDANLDEIAYSDGVAQDATIAMRVINDKASPTISLVIGGSREFKLHGMRLNGRPAYDFSFHSELTEKEIQKAKEADAEDIEEKEKAAKKAKKSGNGKAKANTEETDVEAALEKVVARMSGS